MDAEGYRKRIIECFEGLEKLGGNVVKELAPLKAEARTETDSRKLFLMYQTLREILAAEGGEVKTEFLIEAPNGIKFKAKNINEGQEIAKNYSNMAQRRRK